MMETKTLFSIAKTTKAFGFKGEVGLKLHIRQYDDCSFNKQLLIGHPLNMISPELIGARISDESNEYIGQLISIASYLYHDIYAVLANNKELLIPVLPEIVKNINHTNKEIIISKMSGLLN